MELSSSLGLLAVVVLVVANGFFVATEFAIVAVRRSRLDQLVAEGNQAAVTARDIVGHLDAYIAACQLGITMASLALGWIGEPAFSHLIEPPLARLFGDAAPTMGHGVAAGISFAIITALHIVIGELAPKGLALQKPEATTLWITRPIRLFYLVFRWPIHALNAVGNSVLRVAGLSPASGHEMVHSVEELRVLVTGMQRAGVVEASEARIASRAFQFGELSAGALMTPRTELEALPASASRDEVLELARHTKHNRILLYDGSLDNIVGMLPLRVLFGVLDGPAEFDARKLARPVPVIPATRAADDLLEDMRATGSQLAVVLDEFGGTAGLITLEDLLEALVGHIPDEPTAQPPAPAAALEDMVLDGLLRLDEFEELTQLRLPAQLREAVETLGGLVMLQLDRIPEPGDEVEIAPGWRMQVEQMDGRRVQAVRLRRAS
jgi:putative hemolysin